MDRRITIYIPKRAISQVIKPEGGRGYFRSMYVYPRHRQRGYCLEIMKFAIRYAKEFLEMDILRTAEAAQRNAVRLGYAKVGLSKRWDDCELWLFKERRPRLPNSKLRLLAKVTHERKGGVTEVLYLK
jgi:RimJ/RimL family protein N-acetyltransferase